jgi:hypothetical protein
MPLFNFTKQRTKIIAIAVFASVIVYTLYLLTTIFS